jgi:hypothetical protein
LTHYQQVSATHRRPEASSAGFFTIAAQGFNRLAQGKRPFAVSAGEGDSQGKLQLLKLVIALSLKRTTGIARCMAQRGSATNP